MNESRGDSRNEALDFVKGALVLLMVLYHWLNYFVVLNWDVYRYLRFLTPSFIFISGFIVSRVYLERYSADDPRLRRRLQKRGVKLLVLFAFLNLGVTLLTGERGHTLNVDPRSMWSYVYSVYFTGTGKAAFDVLVPIGYFLILAPIVLRAAAGMRISLSAIAVCTLALMTAATTAGVVNGNLELLSIAILGLAVGSLPAHQIDRLIERPVVLVLAYLCYLAAITVWNIPFPLQVIGVCLSWALLYAVGVGAGSRGLTQRRVIELGKYSLLAYIVQVGVLQLLRRRLDIDSHLDGASVLIPLGGTLLLTLLVVEATSLGRAKAAAVDRLYRAVFA